MKGKTGKNEDDLKIIDQVDVINGGNSEYFGFLQDNAQIRNIARNSPAMLIEANQRLLQTPQFNLN